MKKSLLFTFILSVPLMTSSVFADQENRYALSETDAGTIRLDKQSGEVSFCRPANGGLACTIAADERRAWINITQELSSKMERLEKRIAHLEANAGLLGKSDKPENPLTDDEEKQIDKAMRVGEDFLKRFMGVVKDLQKTYEHN